MLRDFRFGVHGGPPSRPWRFCAADAGTDHGKLWTEEGARVLLVVPAGDYTASDRNRRSGYAMLPLDIKPGTRFPAHHHDGDEECYVISGSVFTVGRRLGPGDFVPLTQARTTASCGLRKARACCSSSLPEITRPPIGTGEADMPCCRSTSSQGHGFRHTITTVTKNAT